MKRWMTWAAVGLAAFILGACGDVGSVEPVDEAPAQVEQGIGTSPLCTSGQTLQGKTEVTGTCGTCTQGGAAGSKGAYYEACCGSGGCTGWKLIKAVCVTPCELN
ncbi:hypothetical protein KRR26_25675 [Corallococcus sp. M34]|uniref:hypothetical protein n=1 Tax=Citreicoccus inhibens TaxID=2849499 RepID=UPI001C239879|nr:hypothetical protein [Citreicoccus inhibens]MBU8899007.1 hypothetical protein [Citreicoccus inhibens]